MKSITLTKPDGKTETRNDFSVGPDKYMGFTD